MNRHMHARFDPRAGLDLLDRITRAAAVVMTLAAAASVAAKLAGWT